MSLPSSIKKLIEQFNKLPGIGSKTSEKFVFHLLKKPKSDIKEFIFALENLESSITTCNQCYDYSEKTPCDICSDTSRDKSIICIVSESSDIIALEKSDEFNGVYHVLGGTINQIANIGLEQLRYKQLVDRIKTNNVQEVILAMDANMEGETTALYLNRELKSLNIKVTRLARGLPMGSDIEYADEITLSNALKGRREL